jgi:hypothetical protein
VGFGPPPRHRERPYGGAWSFWTLNLYLTLRVEGEAPTRYAERMKLYVSHHPPAVVVARDENHAKVLLSAGYKRAPDWTLTELSTKVPGVVLSPKMRE